MTMNRERRLIYNAIRTPDGTVLESRHRHDYKEYKDANGKEYIIDGGLDYIRTTVHEDQVSLALYDDSPHEIQREVLTWGTYGKSGKEDYRIVAIKDMETDHIKNVLALEYVTTGARYNAMVAELEWRGKDE